MKKVNTGPPLEVNRVVSILKNKRRAEELMTLENDQAQTFADILDAV